MPTIYKRRTAKRYVHSTAKQSFSVTARQAIQNFSIRYAAVLGCAGIATVMFISMHASAAPPHTVVNASTFATSKGSSLQRSGRNGKDSVIHMLPGSTITKRVSSYEAISSVAITAKASGKCHGKWPELRLWIDNGQVGTIAITGKRTGSYTIKTVRPAGDYTVKIGNNTSESCDNSIIFESIKMYGPTDKQTHSTITPTPIATPTPSQPERDQPDTTPTPTPSTAPTPTPAETTTTVPGPTEGVCPNEPHTPGGPDGFGTCWPYDGNTGVPDGTTLYPYDGPCTITAPTAIDARTISCDLVVKAPLIITRSIVNSHIDADYGQTLEISDSEVNAGNTTAPAIGYANLTIRRTEITGGQHSVLCSNDCVVEDSWLHNQHNPEGGATHNNAYLSNGGSGHIIRHNSLFCTPKDNTTGGGCTANASFFGDNAVMHTVTVDKNLFMATPSGGYCGSFGLNPSKPFGSNPTQISVTNNIFQRGANNSCGVYGPVTSFLLANNNVWENNSWADGVTIPATP